MTAAQLFFYSVSAVIVAAAILTAVATWWLVLKYNKKHKHKNTAANQQQADEQTNESAIEKLSIEEFLIPIGGIISIILLLWFLPNTVKGGWWILGIIAGIVLVSGVHFFRNRSLRSIWRKRAKATVESTNSGTTVQPNTTTAATVVVRSPNRAANAGKALFWWSLGFIALLLLIMIVTTTGWDVYKMIFPGKEQQTTALVGNHLQSSTVINREAPNLFIGFGNKWETFVPGIKYRYIRGKGKTVAIHFHTEDWRVHVGLYRESNPSVHTLFHFDENYKAVVDEAVDDEEYLVPWYFTVDREVTMLVN